VTPRKLHSAQPTFPTVETDSLDAPTEVPDTQPDVSKDSLAGRAARFVIAGGAMAIFYLGLTSILTLVGMPFQAALIVSFAAAVVVHFTLQRLFVWSHHGEYALPMRGQLRRYLPLVIVQYITTAVATAILPKWLGFPVLPVYIGFALCYALFNFLFFRARVFHVEIDPRPGDGQQP
jgi:putative flippase GtrA